MEILTDAGTIHKCLKSLILQCEGMEGAVAWASTGFEAFDLLLKNQAKIRKLVVGLHFHQTHPDFIAAFETSGVVRFLMSVDGTFHPKTYLFELPGGHWKCLIGSANFTAAAMKSNQEMAVLIDCNDSDSQGMRTQIQIAIEHWWKQGRLFGPGELDFYRLRWKANRIRLNRTAGKFGKWTGKHTQPSGPVAPFDSPIITMEWNEYFQRVKNEQPRGQTKSLENRLAVITEIGKLFHKHEHLQDMAKDDRYKVAGLSAQGGIDYRWFGSMKGAGRFVGAIKANSAPLSDALDRIPIKGEISRDDYVAFINAFRKSFPLGRHGLSTATRLLAMKRPDTFVCLDKKNSRQLSKLFEIPQSMNYDSYWTSIVEQIRASIWWKADRPGNKLEREVWEARAAFLDALTYEESVK